MEFASQILNLIQLKSQRSLKKCILPINTNIKILTKVFLFWEKPDSKLSNIEIYMMQCTITITLY